MQTHEEFQRNVQMMLPPFEIVTFEDCPLAIHFALFADWSDLEEFQRLSPLFAGLPIVNLCGLPAFELGRMH